MTLERDKIESELQIIFDLMHKNNVQVTIGVETVLQPALFVRASGVDLAGQSFHNENFVNVSKASQNSGYLLEMLNTQIYRAVSAVVFAVTESNREKCR